MIKMGSKVQIFMGLTGFLLLSGCGDSAESESEVTETVLGDIDVLEGSTSDEMITVDEFDNPENPAANPDAAGAPAGDDAPTGDAQTEDTLTEDAESSEGDTVIRPRTAPRSGPAAPTGPDNADTGV